MNTHETLGSGTSFLPPTCFPQSDGRTGKYRWVRVCQTRNTALGYININHNTMVKSLKLPRHEGSGVITLWLSASLWLLLLTFIQHQHCTQHSAKHRGRCNSCFENKHLGSPIGLTLQQGVGGVHSLQQQGNTHPSTPLRCFLVSLEQLGVFWNLLWVLRPCLGCSALNWPLWPNPGSENRAEGEADVGNQDPEMEQEQARGTGKESREFSHNQLVRVSQIRYFISCHPTYCSGPLVSLITSFCSLALYKASQTL